MQWCYKFLKRAGFPIRKPTHIGQSLKENSHELFDKFIFNIITFRKQLNIYEDLNHIGNIDQSPIWFDMAYYTTIAKLGEKKYKNKNICRRKIKNIINIMCIG